MKYAIFRSTTKPTGRRGDDAGIDIYVPNDFPPTKLYIGEQVNIPTGIKVEVPAGYMLKAENKSGVAFKKGLTCGACVVDYSYRGMGYSFLFNPNTKVPFIVTFPASGIEAQSAGSMGGMGGATATQITLGSSIANLIANSGNYKWTAYARV